MSGHITSFCAWLVVGALSVALVAPGCRSSRADAADLERKLRSAYRPAADGATDESEGAGAAAAPDPRDAVVRIVSGRSQASGFFVRGPDGRVYVATAFHVVDEGDPTRVERWIVRPDGAHFVEAYPETRVVAYDEDADLALVELVNVPADRTPALPLADPVQDEPVSSWGFPTSSIVESLGLTRKDGRVSNLVTLPAIDRRTGTLRRANAVEGIVVSSGLEPGLSGGPTVNAAGAVVGVNVLKDRQHRGQDAAVRAAELRTLLERVRPPAPPTAEDVEEMLTSIQTDYLALTLAERMTASEFAVLGVSELPRVREFAGLVDRALTLRDVPLVGVEAAALGRMATALPGATLPTLDAPELREGIAACREQEGAMRTLMGELGIAAGEATGPCDDLLVRPATWDLVAATLRWEGRPRDVTVTRVEEVDGKRHLYRASVRYEGRPASFPVLVRWDYGALRLRLFDQDGKLTASGPGSNEELRHLEGTWQLREERPIDAFQDLVTDERITVTRGPRGGWEVVHQVSVSVNLSAPDRAYRCGGGRTMDLHLTQYFAVDEEAGTLAGEPQRTADRRGVLCGEGPCELCPYEPDDWVRLKRIGDRLVMYRATGAMWPHAREFERVSL